MKAILPCAGYATRLYPLTLNKPKHLLKVQGRPIIEHVINKIIELREIDEIFIVTNEKYYPNFKEWLNNFKCNFPINLLNDKTTSNEDRLGQIGDIQFVIETEKINDDVILVSGDNLFNFSLTEAYNSFKKEGKILNALYDVNSIESAKQFGIAIINENNKLIEFQEKPPEPKSTLASLGIYFFKKEHLPLLQNYLSKGNSPDKMGYFMEWLIKNHEPKGYVYKEKWFDIGWIEALKEARRDFKG